NYMDRSFFDENREVLIYLPDQILHYKIFAAYIYDNRHILQSFDFGNKEIYQAYLDRIFSMRDMNSFVDTSMDITSEDKIITLSTCYAGFSADICLVFQLFSETKLHTFQIASGVKDFCFQCHHHILAGRNIAEIVA